MAAGDAAQLLRDIRKKLDDAGILLYAYTYSFRKEFTDEEIERGFQVAQAMGIKYITSSSNVSVAPRVDKYAQKYKIMVGFHGHDIPPIPMSSPPRKLSPAP